MADQKPAVSPEKVGDFLAAAYDFAAQDRAWLKAVMNAALLLCGWAVAAHAGIYDAFDAETFVRAGRRGLLGRHPHPPPGRDPVSTASEEEAAGLLADAAGRLGRAATTTARRGRAEDEVLDAARDADVLVLARGGEPDHLGPKSVGHAERFVVDHASCAVLLVR